MWIDVDTGRRLQGGVRCTYYLLTPTATSATPHVAVNCALCALGRVFTVSGISRVCSILVLLSLRDRQRLLVCMGSERRWLLTHDDAQLGLLSITGGGQVALFELRGRIVGHYNVVRLLGLHWWLGEQLGAVATHSVSLQVCRRLRCVALAGLNVDGGDGGELLSLHVHDEVTLMQTRAQQLVLRSVQPAPARGALVADCVRRLLQQAVHAFDLLEAEHVRLAIFLVRQFVFPVALDLSLEHLARRGIFDLLLQI